MIYVHVTIDKQDEIGGEKADKQTVRCSVKPSSSKKYVVRYVSDIYDMEQESFEGPFYNYKLQFMLPRIRDENQEVSEISRYTNHEE